MIRYAEFEASERDRDSQRPVLVRFSIVLAICAAVLACLCFVVLGAWMNPLSPRLVLLVTDPIALMLVIGKCAAHFWIEDLDARTQGGWDLRVDATVLVDCLCKAGSSTLSGACYIAAWYLRGYSMVSTIDLFILSLALSCVYSGVRHVRRYLTFRRLTLSVERGFPDATFEQLSGSSDGCSCQSDCAICLETMSASGSGVDRVKALPQCGHAFHWRCLRRWLLGGHESCPVCRRSLPRETRILYQFQRVHANQVDVRPPAAAPQPQDEVPPVEQGGVLGGMLRFLRRWQHYTPVSAHGPDEVAAAVATLADMFPQLSATSLRRHLVEVARGDVTRTAEAAVAGLIELDVQGVAEPAAAVET